MTLFSRLLYTIISFALLGASIVLISVAVWRTSQGFWTGEGALDTMLDAIGLVIIAVAVADVGKFLFEEEVVADREMRRPAEARGSLTKFMSILIVALSLESLVLIAKTSREAIGDIVYPGLLMLLAVLTLVGLGLFQKLSQNATAAVPPDREKDDSDDIGDRPIEAKKSAARSKRRNGLPAASPA
ncbi:MAG: GNAT family acetyltransferase [Bosea sp.]|uniref:GNAT family acetyltransferase n=1 Tax=Bosea sp. (in: a-proteobacteria) TaxID=1871050 RepID=UPI001AD5169C|nr:GNAT family acetyltransferase [Bosea sp. (in: a-proteobacteria)]MBN9452725.1 GNAT family acetyltransferase [Bosea sp. (in: a-proteobacteria)]